MYVRFSCDSLYNTYRSRKAINAKLQKQQMAESALMDQPGDVGPGFPKVKDLIQQSFNTSWASDKEEALCQPFSPPLGGSWLLREDLHISVDLVHVASPLAHKSLTSSGRNLREDASFQLSSSPVSLQYNPVISDGLVRGGTGSSHQMESERSDGGHPEEAILNLVPPVLMKC